MYSKSLGYDLDILSISAMSAEPKPLFSSAVIIITERKDKLGIKFIEAVGRGTV